MIEQIFNLLLSVDFYQAVLRMTAPVLLAAMGGLLSERAGIITFSMESMLLMGTAAGVIGSGLTGNVWIGVVAAMVAGILVGLLYAFMVVTIGADQVVTAVAMNLGAIGLSSMIYTLAFAGPGGIIQDTILVEKMPGWQVPLIENVPVAGQIFSGQLPLAYLAFLVVPVVWFILYRTTWGLKIRAVGEHPHAADVLGISVVKVRYLTLSVHRCACWDGGRVSFHWPHQLFHHQHDRRARFHRLYRHRLWPLGTVWRSARVAVVWHD